MVEDVMIFLKDLQFNITLEVATSLINQEKEVIRGLGRGPNG